MANIPFISVIPKNRRHEVDIVDLESLSQVMSFTFQVAAEMAAANRRREESRVVISKKCSMFYC